MLNPESNMDMGLRDDVHEWNCKNQEGTGCFGDWM